MYIINRKIKNLPKKLYSIYKQVKFVFQGLFKALGESYFIFQRLKYTNIKRKYLFATVVIHSARSYSGSDVELYLAHLLSLNRINVYILYDDGVLEHWDSNQVNNIKYYSPYRARWYIKLRHRIHKYLVGHAYKNSRIHFIHYSSIIKQISFDSQIGENDKAYAQSSTKRFFQTGIIDLDKEHKKYYEKSLKNCVISRQVAQYAIDHFNPDLFITSHGIYSVWGPAYRLMKKAGIPTIVWQIPGTTSGHVRLIDRQDQILTTTEDWKHFNNNIPFSDQMFETGRKLLEERQSHTAYDTNEYFSDRVDKNITKNITLNDSGLKFAMFPNVVWDGDVPERNIMFNNVIEWCEFTINVLKDTNNHLYVRFHPSEVTRLAGTVKLEDILRKRLPHIDHYPNITLIPSDSSLDTYHFAQNEIDIGLVFDGTLCLEITYMGIPVIACTNGNFTLDSIVFKPQNKSDYLNWLTKPKCILNKFVREKDERQKSAIKYAYWLFHASLYEFNPLLQPYPPKINYNISTNKSMSCDENRLAERLLTPIMSDRKK